MAYFKTTIKAGKTIEVTKSYTKRVGVKVRGKKEKPTAEEVEKVNRWNAERKLRLLINTNFGEHDLFIGLTYGGEECPPTPAQAKKNITKLIKRLREEYRELEAELKYIHVTEYKNKRIHHHLLINHIEGQDAARIVRGLWEFGRPNFKFLDDTGQYKAIAAYLIKETDKTFRENDGGYKQRYSRSKNLIMPPAKTETVKAKKWSKEPKAPKGYYIDKDTIYNSVDPFTGREYQRYTIIALPPKQNQRKRIRKRKVG